ncbi:MAG: hypothetical protein AAF871_08775 [Pseudomonadota bacterium]
MSAAAAPHLLTRFPSGSAARRPGSGEIRFLADLALAPARVHEACGAARHTFALILAAALRGPILWIAPERRPEALHGPGIKRFVDPARFIFITPKRDDEVLWVMEEALRAGSVPFVVADLPGPPGLTPVRRLHLAAETGAGEGHGAPLGLLLTPGEGGAPGIETRWEMRARHGTAGKRAWSLHRRRARTLPEKAWHVGIERGRFTLEGPWNERAAGEISQPSSVVREPLTQEPPAGVFFPG